MAKMYFVVNEDYAEVLAVTILRADAIRAAEDYAAALIATDTDQAFELAVKLLEQTEQECDMWEEYERLTEEAESDTARAEWGNQVNEMKETYNELLAVASEVIRYPAYLGNRE